MLTGSSNAEKIWNFLRAKEFTEFACAGIIANFDCESRLNPNNLQDSCQGRFSDEEYTALVDSGVYTKNQFVYDAKGYGLAQWTYWSRKKAFYEFTKSNGRSIGDLENALQFFYKELSEGLPSLLHTLKNANSVEEATVAMMLTYEAPYDKSVEAQNKRIAIGQKYYIQFVTSSKGGVSAMGYKYFTKGQAVKVSDHFYSTEFDCHGSGCCTQTIVNEKLIEYLEQIRNHFNAPITITSPYRCLTHNARVGGAVGSRHSKGDAADIVVKGVTPRKVAQYAESIGILGIGLYESINDGYFVHIDTRDYRSFWYGKSEQPRTTFGTYSDSTTPGPNTQNTSNIDTILNMGDRGSAVKAMQEKLIRLGYSCGDYGADGDFGSGTYKAVYKFQEDHNIGKDGIAGSQTLTAIDNAIKELEAKNSDNSIVGCKVRTTASLLNVRSGAGTSNRIVKQVKAGTVATVVEEQNGWCRLDSPNGWVSKDYITKV